MKNALRPLVLSVIAVAVLAGLLVYTGAANRPDGALLVYCAVVMRAPVGEIAKAYEQESGVLLQLQYGGSGTLLSSLEISGEGDLFLAADTSYIDLARDKGLVAEAFPVARIRPVLAVRKGNPKGIHGIADLLRDDVRVALANPDAASIGRTTKTLLERVGRWSGMESAVAARGVFKPTVNDVANDVKLGTVDAGIVWDATAGLYPDLEAIALPEAAGVVEEITLGVLKSSKDPEAALAFARYLTARDRGLKVFGEFGFKVVEGDAWAREPEIP